MTKKKPSSPDEANMIYEYELPFPEVYIGKNDKEIKGEEDEEKNKSNSK